MNSLLIRSATDVRRRDCKNRDEYAIKTICITADVNSFLPTRVSALNNCEFQVTLKDLTAQRIDSDCAQ